MPVNAAVLVTDIRGSTDVLNRCSMDIQDEFLDNFGEIHHRILGDLDSTDRSCEIKSFLYDGYLVLVSEADQDAVGAEAVITAVEAGLRLRQEFMHLCKSGQFTVRFQSKFR